MTTLRYGAKPEFSHGGDIFASASSDATANFFHYLGDPGRLAQNAIARAYVERRADRQAPDPGFERTADELRAAVLDIARQFRQSDIERGAHDCAERRYQGVVRGDLGREPAKRIAADLGISVRQLRRDRSYARIRIVRALTGKHASQTATTLPDAVALELGLALRLSESGRAEAATHVLESLANGGISFARRIEVLTALAEVFLERNLLNEAAAAVRAAHATATEARKECQDAVCEARPVLAAAMLDFRFGNPSHARRREDAVLAILGPSSERDLAAAAIVATILIDRGWRAASLGSWSEARAHLETVESMIPRRGEALPLALIDSLILESHVVLSQSDDLSRAGVAARRALEVAQREGYARRAAVAGAQLGDVQYRMGLHDAGIATARASVEVARQVAAPPILAGAALGVADLELMGGRFEAAIPYLELAAAHLTEGSPHWIRSQLGWADVFVQRGAAHAAMKHALAARYAAERLGNGRLQGAALRRCAQIEHALGKARVAARTIEYALDVLGQHGTRYARAVGYEVSFRVSGRLAHLKLARELLPQQAAQADKERTTSRTGT
jgi:hypothetical protein